MSNIKYHSVTDFSAKLKAFSYQHEAFMALKDKLYAAIFHEQGLGKTKIAIDLLLYWLQKKDIDTVLVVTKKTLVRNWCSEFEVHTNIRPKTLDSHHGNNFYVLNSPVRVIITNFETVSGEKERMKLFLKTRNVAIIIDESTKIKNPESKLTQDFFELSDLFRIRVIMTGTPVANRPYDLWSQIYFLDKGNSLGTDFISFKHDFDLSNDLATNMERRNTFEAKLSDLFEKIRHFSVRETKNSGIISLPDKIYHDLHVGFEIKQKEMYEKVRTEMQILIEQGDETVLDESQEAIKRLLRLVQISSNPKLLDESYDESSAKELLLDHTIKPLLEKGEKVIVWSIFTSNVDYFTRKYKSYHAVRISGKMSIEDRQRSVDAFKKVIPKSFLQHLNRQKKDLH